jgi:Uma2 family endonuclease
MSSALEAIQFPSPEEYLAFELASPVRHEYLAGWAYEMPSENIRHGRITGNVASGLLQQLRGTPFEVFSLNIKVRIRSGTGETYYYSDVLVDSAELSDAAYWTENPRIIFEVVSPDTERIDRGEKLLNYQTLSSLEAYVLIDQKAVSVVVYRRTDNGFQAEVLNDLSASLDLPTIGCSLPLRAVYERTELLRGSAAA